jgi:hypothetical protein
MELLYLPGIFSDTNVELPEFKTQLRSRPTFVKTVYIHINDFRAVQHL